ncbi:hypothetical Protein YC6258_00542 [Gynuella sunshinyii YC6258]|uniref:Uncharacterized protein n=1 Tax=Gynuella sunshinyii YC6258 TaxID=1445510 RepID=A0A0C5VDH1_9GAMM|nr:hypothetical Protein YC6258_00542 [Gynuella sunshinyii YC6258]
MRTATQNNGYHPASHTFFLLAPTPRITTILLMAIRIDPNDTCITLLKNN